MVDFTKISISEYDGIRDAVVRRDTVYLKAISDKYNLFTTCCVNTGLALEVFTVYLNEFNQEYENYRTNGAAGGENQNGLSDGITEK